MTAPVIDAHQHFWDPEGAYDYPWLSGPYASIRRPFSIDDLGPSLEQFGVDGTVAVQSWNSLDETRDYLRIAEANPRVAGVVGWVDLTDPGVGHVLDELRRSPEGRYLVGVRHLLHEEPDPAWILRDDVGRGLAALAEAGLAYDLVGKTVHLPPMLQRGGTQSEPAFRARPHCQARDPGRRVRALGPTPVRTRGTPRSRVVQAFGMITEADWRSWSPQVLQPFVDEVVQIFTPQRCMFGTDWPVCLVAGSYGQVVEALHTCLRSLPEADREQIFGRSAIEAYRLPEFTA